MSTLAPLQNRTRLFSKPSVPARPRNGNSAVDRFESCGISGDLGLIQPDFKQARVSNKEPKQSTLQMAGKGIGLLVAFASITGLAGCGSEPAPPKETQTEVVQETESKAQDTEITLTEVKEEPKFSEGRTLLVDRSDKVQSGQFDPDPSMATETRGKRSVFEETYIHGLVNRNLTEVPEGAPAFTAVGADESQSSKVYFDGNLELAEWGGGTVKSGNFLTRPTRMKGRGSGISDKISQHQLSCIYRLEEATTMDGVQMDPGLYRLITMAPSSNVATKSMDKGVCPGHRLIKGESGFSGDYLPTQVSPEGEQLRVNPDDIVQVWTLNAAEAAEYQ